MGDSTEHKLGTNHLTDTQIEQIRELADVIRPNIREAFREAFDRLDIQK